MTADATRALAAALWDADVRAEPRYPTREEAAAAILAALTSTEPTDG